MAWTNVLCVLGMLASASTLSYLTRCKGPLPRPKPPLTVIVTYDHCSGIGKWSVKSGNTSSAYPYPYLYLYPYPYWYP